MIHEPPQSDPAPQGGGNAALAWFRFFVWCMPTAFVGGLMMLIIWAFFSLRKTGVHSGLGESGEGLVMFWVAGSMAGILALGYLDARLKRQQEKISQDDNWFDDVWHMLKFFLFQLALIPCISLTIFALVDMVAPLVGR